MQAPGPHPCIMSELAGQRNRRPAFVTLVQEMSRTIASEVIVLVADVGDIYACAEILVEVDTREGIERPVARNAIGMSPACRRSLRTSGWPVNIALVGSRAAEGDRVGQLVA